MAKFCGKIGISQTVETRVGIYEEQVREHPVYGDLLKSPVIKNVETSNLNDDIRINNEISILADSYIVENASAIKFIRLSSSPDSTKWKVASVTLDYPRMTLIVGGVYNG